ncbi:MAG: DUF6265 family protein [Myxococcota bacterium]
MSTPRHSRLFAVAAGAMLLVGAASCGGASESVVTAPDRSAAPAERTAGSRLATLDRPAPGPLALRLSWLEGHWRAERTSETWHSAGNIMVGIGFGVRDQRTAFFEVMVIGQVDGAILLTALPNGLKATDFTTIAVSARQAAFSNPANEFPKNLRYTRTDGSLTATLSGGSRPEATFTYQRQTGEPAPELLAADKRFAADAARRGGTAWTDHITPSAALWSRNSGLIDGAPAISAVMNRMLGDTGARLEWQPFASGLSPRGDLGYTIGRYHLLQRDRAAAAIDLFETGSYALIWRRQDDGAWRVIFDVGVPD